MDRGRAEPSRSRRLPPARYVKRPPPRGAGAAILDAGVSAGRPSACRDTVATWGAGGRGVPCGGGGGRGGSGGGPGGRPQRVAGWLNRAGPGELLGSGQRPEA